MRTFPAKYRTTCPRCRGIIAPGDHIAKLNGAWGHPDCSVQPDLSIADELPERQHSRRAVTYRMPKPEPQTVTTFNAEAEASPLAFLGNVQVAIAANEPALETIPVPDDFSPSTYQAAIYDWLEHGAGHAVVIACPGSGKTTTLKHTAPYLPRGKCIVALAFGKKNARDLQKVMPEWIEARTFHSLALKNVMSAYGRGCKVEERKGWKLLDELTDQLYAGVNSGIASALPQKVAEVIESDGANILKLVGLMKNTLSEDLEALSEHYGITVNSNADIVFEIAEIVFHRSIDQARTWVDFDDMIYLCAMGKVACAKYDFILVDETQDQNRARLEMMVRMLADGGRILCVGDPLQSIFGFAGADTTAIPRIIERLGAVTLPLSISYRLPFSHVRMLNDRFPNQHIETRPDAAEGEIITLPESQLAARVHPGDMIICRTNAPLVEPCFALIREGIKAVIVGRDIGKGLNGLLDRGEKKSQDSTLRSVLSWLNEWAGREASRLINRDKNTQAANLLDQVATLDALAAECDTVSQVKARIASVFSDEAVGVVFSSVHRAKGLEADNVYLLHPELIPHPMAKVGWEIEQEQNILFVALSRSKHSLYFVTPEEKR